MARANASWQGNNGEFHHIPRLICVGFDIDRCRLTEPKADISPYLTSKVKMAHAGRFDVEHGRQTGALVEKDVKIHSVGSPGAVADEEASPEPYSHLIYHQHYSSRAPWLRASVLGANDGLVSVASLMLGKCFPEATWLCEVWRIVKKPRNSSSGALQKPGLDNKPQSGCATLGYCRSQCSSAECASEESLF
jgi:hypothetical protein